MAGGSSKVPSMMELTLTESVCSEELERWAKVKILYKDIDIEQKIYKSILKKFSYFKETM